MLKVSINDAGRDTTYLAASDCTIRALALFLNESYNDVLALMKEHTDYTERHGCTANDFHKLLLDLGLRYVKQGVRLTAANPERKLPKKAILHFREHVATYENGVLYDAFHSTRFAGMKQTKGYWYLPE